MRDEPTLKELLRSKPATKHPPKDRCKRDNLVVTDAILHRIETGHDPVLRYGHREGK